jgi:imidazolonepropionase-like amidohydrolase/Tol biopolymer transport system component
MTTRLLPLIAALTLAFSAHADDAKDAPKDAKKPSWDVNHPPGPSATASIDVHSGTWMSVDVSPDGQQIVFDLLGDLYVLPIGGGEAKALTHSIAWEQQARFSPDGKKIAYVSDAGGGDNVWVMNADGSDAKAVTKEDFRMLNNPVWHPNGKFILARKHYTGTRSAGSGEIWLYALDGAGTANKGVQLNEKPNWEKDLGEPALSPDGNYLYYSHDATPGKTFEYNKDSNKEIFKIYRQDLRDGTTEAFVQGAGGAIRPVPSPDGKYLAFVRRVRNAKDVQVSTLFLKDLSTGEERPAYAGLERDMQESWSVYGVYPSFAWMPDGKTIVLWAHGKILRVDPFKGTAAEIPFHVKDTREVRPALRVQQDVAPAQFDVHQLRWAKVAPDGKSVVYSALGQLYVKPLPDGPARRLTKQEENFEFFPSFSRDGRELVYVSWNDEKLGSVRKLDIASGRETVLTTEPAKYMNPSFSPDGKTVAYQKSRGGFLLSPWHGLETGIYLVSADGKGTPERIAKSGSSPQWGADSKAVYLTRNEDTSEVDQLTKLIRLDLATRKETEVARSDFASSYAISPDGQQLGFTERYHAFVTALPQTGKPLKVGPKMDALPVRQLDVNSANAMAWTADGKNLSFVLGDELFVVPVDGKGKAPEQGVKIGFTAKSDKPTGKIALVGARIATMKGDEVIEDGVIVIDGNRIAAIGPAASTTIPADAKRVDAKGKTIVPGFVDAHWHGSMGESGFIPQQSWVNYASLSMGVTTIHDPSNDSAQVFTSSELQRTGKIVGPRIYSTGTILYGAMAPYTAVINSLDDALTHLKRQKAEGAISVKSYNQPRREQRQQVLEAARQTGMMVVPEGGSLFEANMTMVVDGHTGVEHALPVANVYDDVKQFWPQTQVGYTPTLIVAYGGLDGEHYWYARTDVWKHPILSKYVPASVLQPRSVRRETAPEQDFNVNTVAKTATELSRAGVKVNIGAHGQREGLGTHWEMWSFGIGGMTSLEALRTATINPAHYLGLDKDVGSLEVGKLADLVVISGDVLKDIRQSDRIDSVMVNGRLYDVATMNEKVSREKARKPFFFEGANGKTAPIDEELGRTHGDD